MWQSMTFPPPQPEGTLTAWLALEGARQKKVESRETKKACPYQCFFSVLVSEDVVLGESMSWSKLM